MSNLLNSTNMSKNVTENNLASSLSNINESLMDQQSNLTNNPTDSNLALLNQNDSLPNVAVPFLTEQISTNLEQISECQTNSQLLTNFQQDYPTDKKGTDEIAILHHFNKLNSIPFLPSKKLQNQEQISEQDNKPQLCTNFEQNLSMNKKGTCENRILSNFDNSDTIPFSVQIFQPHIYKLIINHIIYHFPQILNKICPLTKKVRSKMFTE